jgi:hypothetical protein
MSPVDRDLRRVLVGGRPSQSGTDGRGFRLAKPLSGAVLAERACARLHVRIAAWRRADPLSAMRGILKLGETAMAPAGSLMTSSTG